MNVSKAFTRDSGNHTDRQTHTVFKLHSVNLIRNVKPHMYMYPHRHTPFSHTGLSISHCSVLILCALWFTALFDTFQ